MTSFHIGEISITSIPEIEDTSFELKGFFPQSVDTDVVANSPWLSLPHFDPATGRIRLSMHSWLLQTGKKRILIDTCIGNDKERYARKNWTGLNTPFLARLARAGVSVESVDYVLCTHLHADHVGWNTRLLDGRWVPTFPNAKYVFGKREYAYWQDRYASEDHNSHHLAAYIDSVLPVIEGGQALIVDDLFELEGLLKFELAAGHTPGHLAFWLESSGSRAVFSGDVIHHPIQTTYPHWTCMGCLVPAEANITRRRLLATIADQNIVLFTAHFLSPHAGTVRSRTRGFEFAFSCDEC